MPMPCFRASRAEWKWTGLPSSSISPSKSAWTPAMIFIRVDLPARCSPTRAWISPRRNSKSTPRSASTPPKDFEMCDIFSLISTSVISDRLQLTSIIPITKTCLGSGPGKPWRRNIASDEELLLHPGHARSIVLGDDRTIGDDMLGNAFAGLRAVHHGRHAGDDSAAVNPAGRIAHRREHASVLHRGNGGRHGVDAADQDALATLGFHHIVGGERHV